MDKVVVHPRIMRRHPQLTEANVQYAWCASYYEALRPESPHFPEYLRLGMDEGGRELEMVGVPTEEAWLVYHANTPVSKRVRDEIKRNERRR